MAKMQGWLHCVRLPTHSMLFSAMQNVTGSIIVQIHICPRFEMEADFDTTAQKSLQRQQWGRSVVLPSCNCAISLVRHLVAS